MTGYRRKLMMMCPYVPQPETTISPYARVSFLTSSLERGLFIKAVDAAPTVYYSVERAGNYLTWDYIYTNIMQRYVWVTIEENDVVMMHYSKNDITVPLYASTSYVTVGALRTIFPQGLKLTTTNNELVLEYDPSLVVEEDLDRYITLYDLYDYIPVGCKLVVLGNNLHLEYDIVTVAVRQTYVDTVEATNPAVDSSLAGTEPDAYVYKVLDNTKVDWILTKDILYQMVSPGIHVTDAGELAYDATNSIFGNDSVSYDKKEPVTNDLFNFIFNGYKISIDQTNHNIVITK